MRAVLILFSFLLAVSLAYGKKRTVCYYTNWARYRDGAGRFTPKNIDPAKCTNALYAFALLDENSLTIVPSDPDLDVRKDYYGKFVKRCKSNANCKPSLSLGGWSDSGNDKYSRMLNDDGKRANFIRTTIQFLEKYGFEGLDIDIEYPACPQGDCSKGNGNDRNTYQQLMTELRGEFNKRGWVLSAAISADPGQISTSYKIKSLSDVLDWVGVMTYDYSQSSDPQTGPVSPLKSAKTGSTEKTINDILSKGAASDKLVVGVPSYGYTYKLANADQHGYYSPSTGPGVQGEFTKSNGNVAYYEVCQFISQGWTVKESDRLGAYAYKSTNWVSYNSVKDVVNKANFVNEKNLGGMMMWDITTDDFTGQFCNQGVYPLLSAMNDNLK